MRICYIEGDGIGKEIWPAAKKVFDAALKKADTEVEWLKVLVGEEAFEKTGENLPGASLEEMTKNKVVIKGPLGTPVGEGFRSINVELRQRMDLYACVRPVEYFEGVVAPVKNPQDVDMTIFRENTEDVYSGIEFESGSEEARKLVEFINSSKIRFPQTSAIGIKPVSPDGSKRLMKAACEYAVANGKKNVTIVHKGNIMKFTEGGFRAWAYEVAKEYPSLEVDDVIADNFLQQILLKPKRFEVIATLNLNGDYISDALAAQVGGLGLAPGANINYETGHAVFEATHGSAPRRAGQNYANPSSVILSGVMMFEYIGMKEAAALVKQAIVKALKEGESTKDLGGSLGTVEFADGLVKNISSF